MKKITTLMIGAGIVSSSATVATNNSIVNHNDSNKVIQTTRKRNWTHFKNSALQVTADQILSEAKATKAINQMTWPIGTSAQITWISGDQAEFDIYGSLNSQHPAQNEYKGMNGKPHADDNNQTVTAIISKKGKDGAYDSDPIKATATFKSRSAYSLKDWQFKKVTQLQSLKHWQDLLIKENTWVNHHIDAFLNNNWINFGKDYSGNQRSKNINKTLIDAGYLMPQDRGNRNWGGRIINFKTPLSNGKGYQAMGGLDLTASFSTDVYPKRYTVYLYSNFIYANGKDAKDGGTAFNYTWTAVAV